MRDRPSFVVVGGNLAAGAAVTTLRQEGFDGGITVIGGEPHPPYERPPLSKSYLRGEEQADKALLHPPDWYQENEVELRLSTWVERLDPPSKTVVLRGGDQVPYDKVLVATGGRNRRLDTPGVDREGVLQLRTLEDADAIKAEARPGRHALVVGAGFIGSEVTASLRTLGVEVTVIEHSPAPLLRVLGPDVAAVYAQIHLDHGVRFVFGEGLSSIEGNGRIEAVVTDKGSRIECDFALLGVGIQPNVEVVAGTGVAVDNGLLVDEFCRTTVEDVYAAGDVANHWHPVFGRRMRVEHWDNALKQGATAARTMLGQDEPFDDPHWFWSDQYEHNLQYMGMAIAWDQFVVRGSLEARDFTGFYLKDGLIEGVVSLNRGKDVRRSGPLIKARQPIDPEKLRDESVDLRKLAQSLTKG